MAPTKRLDRMRIAAASTLLKRKDYLVVDSEGRCERYGARRGEAGCGRGPVILHSYTSWSAFNSFPSAATHISCQRVVTWERVGILQLDGVEGIDAPVNQTVVANCAIQRTFKCHINQGGSLHSRENN